MADVNKELKKHRDNIFRLQTLAAELDRKLVTAQGELGFLKDEHMQLPSDPTITAQALADHRKKMEAKEGLTQGLVDDRANVENALTEARIQEKEVRKAHFHKHTAPEKTHAVLRIGRSIAKQMQDISLAMKEEARRMEQLSQELHAETRQVVERPPTRESQAQRASHFVMVSLTQTLELWQNVEKGFNEYAKGVGE